MINVMSRNRKMIHLVPLISVLALTAYLLLVSQTTAQAQEPPGDCWGGTLASEPLHCYILEETQKAGLIQVSAIFYAPTAEDGLIYVVLEQEGEVSESASDFFREKAYEYLRTPEGSHRYQVGERCGQNEGTDLERCMNGVMGGPYWEKYTDTSTPGFPEATRHDNVLLLTGGIEGRKEEPGWAAWQQLWPGPAVGAAIAADVNTIVFDVSDVDTKSDLGDDDCRKHIDTPVVDSGYCNLWEFNGHLGIAGVHSYPGVGTIYFQIKSPIPTDSEELEKLKLDLLGDDEREKERFRSRVYNIEVIPVKYDLGQLWKWAVILNRFALSKGNTIGVLKAGVGTNGVAINYPADIREVIGVLVLDEDVATAAFQTLLPALGIPVDAVGNIGELQAKPLTIDMVSGPNASAVAARPDTLATSAPGAGTELSNELTSNDQAVESSDAVRGRQGPQQQMEGTSRQEKQGTSPQRLVASPVASGTDASAAPAPEADEHSPVSNVPTASKANELATIGAPSWALTALLGLLAVVALLGTGAYILHLRRG